MAWIGRGVILALLVGWTFSLRAEGILVRYRSPTSLPALAVGERDLVRIETPPAEFEERLQRLLADPEVAGAEPDYLLESDNVPDDPFFELFDLYNYQLSRIADVWESRTSCDTALVAVVDTGIDVRHPDLQENLWTNPGEIAGNGIDDDDNGFVDDIHGYDFTDEDGEIDDEGGHGTAIAGIIGARGNNQLGLAGVCWSVPILTAKAFDGNQRGRLSWALEAIDYSIEQGARVLNLSWTISDGKKSQFLEEAIRRAGAQGVLVVASAGNDARDLAEAPVYPAAYPMDNLLTVSAHDSTGGLADFSNYGEGIVDLAAPGEEVLTTWLEGRYAYFSGTSAAAPHVSGMAALLYAEAPDLDPEELADLLRQGRQTAVAGLALNPGNLDALNAFSLLGQRVEDEEAAPQLDSDVGSSANETLGGSGCSLVPSGSIWARRDSNARPSP